jgi:hypothetical protein
VGRTVSDYVKADKEAPLADSPLSINDKNLFKQFFRLALADDLFAAMMKIPMFRD